MKGALERHGETFEYMPPGLQDDTASRDPLVRNVSMYDSGRDAGNDTESGPQSAKHFGSKAMDIPLAGTALDPDDTLLVCRLLISLKWPSCTLRALALFGSGLRG